MGLNPHQGVHRLVHMHLCPHFLHPGVVPTLFLIFMEGQESPQKTSDWAKGTSVLSS